MSIDHTLDNQSPMPEYSWHPEIGPADESYAAQLADVDGLKTFPVVASQALSLLSNPDFRVSEVTEIIKQDPSLATGILRMANSAFFAGTKSISSVHQAFVRLGRRSVQEVVAAVATMDLFPDTDGIGKRFRDHLAATAALVQTLAREFTPEHVEGIFLAGLLHDVGKMLLIESREFDYALEEEYMFAPDRMSAQERDLLGYDHASLGGCVLERWKMPSPIPWVVAWHHMPDKAYTDERIGPMVAMLRIADKLDFLIANKSETIEEEIEKLADSPDLLFVGITPDRIIKNLESLSEARSQALSLFGG